MVNLAVPGTDASVVSKPINRIRWATRRMTVKRGQRKRESLRDRFHKRTDSVEKRDSTGKQHDGDARKSRDDNATLSDAASDGAQQEPSSRRIFFNIPLPDDARDEEGHPITQFARNKIRTAKYTPLSFVPKNLWFQFHNVANVYFLFIIILGFFSIFGAANPGLAAVPLIVILVITAIKDAIEDWRRTVLDSRLNNTPVQRLVGYNNVNTAEDHISLWRRIKKMSTRGIMKAYKWYKSVKSKKPDKGKTYTDRALDDQHHSVDTRRTSVFSRAESTANSEPEAEGIQMTPVPSPLPGENPRKDERMSIEGNPAVTVTEEDGHITALDDMPLPQRSVEPTKPPKKFYGSLIDPFKDAPDKARFKDDYWKNVQVGDFIRLYNEEPIPADVVILSTSDSDGACYVETKNLDGETNLKVRHALHCGRQVKHARNCETSSFVIESEPPHANLYAFNGAVRWLQRDPKDPDAPGTEMAEPISINNLVLRGSSLKNTEWALGVVVFTGEETKIMLNSGITPSKRAKISKDLNWNVIYNFVILFIMCLISGVVQGTTWGEGSNSLDFFEYGSYGGSPFIDGFITFWAAVILYQNLVPVSLYITLEIIRTAQAYFIYSDIEMYYQPIDYPCTPKSWNISDDLGQVEYIFSDKTGTLTQNVMEFKKCTINGSPYGEAYTEALAGLQRRQGVDVEEEGRKAKEQIELDRVKMLGLLRQMHNNPYLRDEELTFIAPDFVSDLGNACGPEQQAANEQFMLALALCHTVISERTPGDPPKIQFKAQSPDEAALVSTARDCGFTVLGGTDNGIVVNVLGEEREYTVLNTLEFNSSRKRMSAIMRMPDGKIILFCKGADSIIYSRLKVGEQQELRQATAEHLEMFAREGLRTLCIAQRELSEEEYQAWNLQHDAASAAITNREDKLEEVSDMIERDLTLLGGTAIEDRLQDGVPDAIALLGNAGIKLWVLTGDKVETAINIGFSCNLLDNDMDLIVFKIDDESIETAEKELDKHLAAFNMTGSDAELAAARKNHEPPEPTHAVIIDGESLKLVLDDRIKQKFLLLCKQCRSVLCCRVSPSQKAAVVSMVKLGLDCHTLSIGDGANDVAMIQEAHVGVGLAGEEGRQAVMSSDYAIAQFRFLTRLLLVHGRWSYRRMAETIANFFYKNLVWTFALFWYSIYDNFDCAYVFDYTYILLYNLAFTSLPVILMGVLDQDVDDKVSLAVPQLYRRGIERKEWTQTKFWAYMIDGAYQSVMVYYMAHFLFSPATFNTMNGLGIDDAKRMGVFIGTSAVIVANLYMLMNVYRWDWLQLLIVTISILLIWFWTGVYTAVPSSLGFYQAAPQVYGQLTFWADILVTTVISLFPRFAIKSFQKVYFPYDVDIIREQVTQGKFDYLRETDALMPPSPEKMASMSSSDALENGDTGAAAKRSSLARPPVGSPDDERPIYPPSVAQTSTTRNPRSQNGSDGTDYTGHRISLGERPPRSSFEEQQRQLERRFPPRASSYYPPQTTATTSPLTPTTSHNPPGTPNRFSFDRVNREERPRPSFDRARLSMDRVRPSFEASDDFTSAARLSRIESRHSGGGATPSSLRSPTPVGARELRRTFTPQGGGGGGVPGWSSPLERSSTPVERWRTSDGVMGRGGEGDRVVERSLTVDEELRPDSVSPPMFTPPER